MIEIKTSITGWHNVTKEIAQDFVKFLMKRITTMQDKELIDYINSNKLKGITVQELLKGI